VPCKDTSANLEMEIWLRLSRPLVNHLTALMPTLEGLFLATVLDGPSGRVRIRFDSRCEPQVQELCRDMQKRYPGQWRRE